MGTKLIAIVVDEAEFKTLEDWARMTEVMLSSTFNEFWWVTDIRHDRQKSLEKFDWFEQVVGDHAWSMYLTVTTRKPYPCFSVWHREKDEHVLYIVLQKSMADEHKLKMFDVMDITTLY